MAGHTDGQIRLEKHGFVAHLVLDRPDKLNAMTVAMDHRMNELVYEINNDKTIRCVLLSGAGDRAFSAGSDITDLDEYGDNWSYRNRFDSRGDYARAVWLIRKPVVAAIHGYCIGGGLEMASASDIRIATPQASFGAGEIRWGWHGGSGQTQFLTHLVGPGWASRLLLTGERIDGDEALRIGLVQQLVPLEQLIETGMAIAQSIAEKSPIAIEKTKNMVRVAQNVPLDAALLVENDSFSYLMMTEDAAEGRAAFAEKRAPQFKGAMRMTDPVAIADGLFRVDAPLGDRFASLYLVVGSESVLLFDTGTDGMIPAYVVPGLKAIGAAPRDVRTVVVSHCDVDHFGGVADAREQFPSASILAHSADRSAMENFGVYLSARGDSFRNEYGWAEDPAVLEWCRAVTRETSLDGDAVDGQVVDLGGTQAVIWHVPGHSAGHTAVEVPSANAILVSDAVLGSSVDLADGAPAFPPTYRHVDDYLATISRLEAARHDLLLTAHYPQFSGAEAQEFLVRSRDFVTRLDALVVDALSDELTLAQLLAQLNPVAGDWPVEGTEGALAFPVVGHLERLLATGAARRAGERDGVAVWTAA